MANSWAAQGTDYSDRYDVKGKDHLRLRGAELEVVSDRSSFAKFDLRDESVLQVRTHAGATSRLTTITLLNTN